MECLEKYTKNTQVRIACVSNQASSECKSGAEALHTHTHTYTPSLSCAVQTLPKFLFRQAIRIPSKQAIYRGADKSLARPTSRCILFDGENISFDPILVILYIYIYIYI